MTTDIAGERIRLRTPADIVEAVPYFVGFHPDNSVVLMSLRGERSRVGLTLRQDLPPPQQVDDCARTLANHVQADGACRAVVVCYPPSGGSAHPVVRPLATAIADVLRGHQIELVDALCVADGRWWSLQCDDVGCCPPDGTAIRVDPPTALAAAMTARGQAVLASREALEHTLDPVGGLLRAAMERALDAAAVATTARVRAESKSAFDAESLSLFVGAVTRRLAGGVELGVDDAARLIVGISSIPVRDEMTTWFEGDWGDATRSLLGDLVRRAIPPFEVAALAVLAWIAYQQGDGAIAGMAVDRVLAAEPDYGLAAILDRALTAGMNPAVFQESSRQHRRTTAAAGGDSG